MPSPETLSEPFKDALRERWKAYDISLDKGLDLRFRFQTDLFWACQVLGYKKLQGVREWNGCTIDTHWEVTEFFVQKDPSFRSFDDFARSIKDTHERMLLLPRGGFKSSIHIADLVQWITCFPNIAALILCGIHSLAVGFVGELSTHFTLQDDGMPRLLMDGKPSLFQILFPEHCIKPAEAKREEFLSPARRANIREPTIKAAGIDQNLSGWHFDLLDLDDVVTNENSRTRTRLQELNRQISINKAMLHPYGFFNVIGTWYDVADFYGISLKHDELLKKQGEDSATKILLRPAWWLKPESIKKGITDDTAREEDYMLWFPEQLDYKFLRGEQRKDQEGFAIKYLNNPLAAHIVKFPRELMISRTVDTLPQMGIVFEAWDLAYSEKESAKYTVGVAGLFSPQGIYIMDMQRGRFGEYELPGVMAAFAHKWKPRRVAVEDSMGARWLTSEIRREQEKLRANVPFEFVSLGKGTKSHNKEAKAKPAARLLGDGRLYFWKAINGLEEMYNELEAFPKGQFTDIVCSLSLLVNHFSNFAETAPYQPIAVSDRIESLRHQMIYGLGPFAPRVQDGTMMAMQGGPQETDRDPLSESGLY